MIEIKIEEKEANQRIDKYIKKYLSNAPLSFIYKLFRKKDIKVNNHWVNNNYIICEDDVIRIYISEEQLKEFSINKEIKKDDLRYPIIYEDENILIINKPRGILVHGGDKEKRITLTNEVLNYLYFKGEYDPSINKGFTPAPAHRLDRNTSGIVVYGKTLPALQCLQELFKNKDQIEKIYIALVVGNMNKVINVDAPLLKDSSSGLVKVASIEEGAKSAHSIFKPIKRYGDYTLVEVKILTGRTHQIRVHAAYSNYPVIGDGKYGNFAVNKVVESKYHFTKQFLHAKKLAFKKISGVLHYLSSKEFLAPLSKEEEELLEKLEH